MRSVVNLPRLFVLGLAAGAVVGALLLLQDSGGGVSESGEAIRDAELLGVDAPAGLEVEAKAGALAPDFEASMLTGQRTSLSDYRGQAVVLNFWATWCVSCLAEIPELERVWRERSEQGLVILGVNVGEDVGRAERFLRELGATYPSVLDPDQTIARGYRVQGLPLTVFITSEGQIARLIVGQISYEIFDRFARVALGEKDVPGVDDPLPLRFSSPLPPKED